MKQKKIIFLFICVFLFLIVGCKKNDVLQVRYAVEQNARFGGINICVSSEDFFQTGFDLGDSVNIVLNNGKGLENVPLFNGYYVRREQPVLVAYPNLTKIHFCRGFGADLYQEFEVNENSVVTISLNEKGKYKNVQKALNLIYSNNPNDYESDIKFANFRALSGGNICPNKIFRGASPIDGVYHRNTYADNLIKQNRITFALNLADTSDEIIEYSKNPEYHNENSYYFTLFQQNMVFPGKLVINYGSDIFKSELGKGLKALSNQKGSVYIHCTEGKDRTGFVCLVLECLCNASYEELKKDYMITYENYYSISEEKNSLLYNIVVEYNFNDMLLFLTKTTSDKDIILPDYSEAARSYLTECGLSEVEINNLKNRLEGK